MRFEINSSFSSRCTLTLVEYPLLIKSLREIENMYNVFFIVDKKVFNNPEYSFFSTRKNAFVFNPDERSKTLNSAEKIYSFLLRSGADRYSIIIGVGGGITLDIAGFVASTFMRGINFSFIPTTLLAMVDASIGGKNGVNFRGYKNYIGTFNHPDSVYICPHFLDTLPEREFKVGLSEVIKYGLIFDSDFFNFLVEKEKEIKRKEKRTINYLIEKSVSIKVDIVKRDFREGDIRRILNFGHTLGHAIERIQKVSHGEGVAAGMVFASFVSYKKNHLTEKDFLKIVNTIDAFKLPLCYNDLNNYDILQGIGGDKKKRGDSIDFVLLKSIGKPIVQSLSLKEISEALDDMRKHCRERFKKGV